MDEKRYFFISLKRENSFLDLLIKYFVEINALWIQNLLDGFIRE